MRSIDNQIVWYDFNIQCNGIKGTALDTNISI